MGGFFKWVIAGLIGGLVGAAVWAGISYATNYEIGWIAWGIGALVGFCVRFVAGEAEEGLAPGVTAALIAILAVLGGKYAAVQMLVASVRFDAAEVTLTPEDMIVSLADDIVREREAKGQKVQFPPGKILELARKQEDYPPAIWREAQQKWHALGPDGQQQRMAEQRQHMQAMFDAVKSRASQDAFAESFSLFDALWFFLAAATAYRLGHGNLIDDDD